MNLDANNLPHLANGKPHISFSEAKEWNECTWKHKLVHIDKLKKDEDSIYLSYGSILHDEAESFLKTRQINYQKVFDDLTKEWEEKKLDSEDYINHQKKKAKLQGWNYKHVTLETWLKAAKNCLEQLPIFMEKTFPGWKTVAAEYPLYESIDGIDIGKFKGFIDCIIELPNGKHVIIDWKTAGPRGWDRKKQTDIMFTSQIILYKHYWMKIKNMTSREISTAFVLLKRESKPEKSITLIKVASGPESVKKSNKLVINAIKGMGRKLYLKNRNSCKFCEFYKTEHCK